MSYFDACEKCGEPFEERSYDWAVCKSCHKKIDKAEYEKWRK